MPSSSRILHSGQLNDPTLFLLPLLSIRKMPRDECSLLLKIITDAREGSWRSMAYKGRSIREAPQEYQGHPQTVYLKVQDFCFLASN